MGADPVSSLRQIVRLEGPAVRPFLPLSRNRAPSRLRCPTAAASSKFFALRVKGNSLRKSPSLEWIIMYHVGLTDGLLEVLWERSHPIFFEKLSDTCRGV